MRRGTWEEAPEFRLDKVSLGCRRAAEAGHLVRSERTLES